MHWTLRVRRKPETRRDRSSRGAKGTAIGIRQRLKVTVCRQQKVCVSYCGDRCVKGSVFRAAIISSADACTFHNERAAQHVELFRSEVLVRWENAPLLHPKN